MVTARQIEAYTMVMIRGFSYKLASSAMGITRNALHLRLHALYTEKPELKPLVFLPKKIISVGRVKDYDIKRKF